MFTNQPYKKEMERLILYEWGIHLIDVLRYFFGEVSWVFARMDRTSPVCVGEDRALLILIVGGVNCLVDISWGTIEFGNKDSQLENVTVEGDRGSIKLLPDEQNTQRISNHEGTQTRPAYEGTPEDAYLASFTAAQTHFADCLRFGKKPETVAEDNIQTLRATIAAYDSAAANKVIYLQ